MNIWFRTSNQKSKPGLTASYGGSFNSQLPIINEHNRRYESIDDDDSKSTKGLFAMPNPLLNTDGVSGYSKLVKQKKDSSLSRQRKKYDQKSDSDYDDNPLSEINKTNKSVRFNLNNESMPSNPQKKSKFKTNSIIKTPQTSYYGGMGEKNSQVSSEISEKINQDEEFMEFKHIKNAPKAPQIQRKNPSQNSISFNNIDISNINNSKPSIQKESSNPVNQTSKASISFIPKTGRSLNSMSVNYLCTEERGNEWNLNQTNRSIDKNSVGKTTGRKQNIKEHIISIIQYCSNEVGIAIYNTTNGEIFLCQIIERLTYFRTISTIQRFYPLEIIYSSSLEHTPLMKKINEKFKTTTMRNFRRIVFDETKGFQIYNQRGNKQEYNPDNKFIAYSALNALIFYLENSYETKFNYSSLKMRWHLLEDLLIIESQTISSLEIFLNAETKEKSNCFINNFTCLTFGGTRMLRANLLQPLSNEQMIKNRQDLVQIFLDDKVLYDTICSEIQKFKNFEIITAKFILMPKEKNVKSLKTYLSAIYSISHMCLLLTNFYKKIEVYIAKNLPVINRLFSLINDIKITQLKQDIESNFDEEMLKNYESGVKGKKDNFIFLLKMQRMQDDFIEVMRITYSHTMQDILRTFKNIKQKSGCQLKLLYNEFRGYFIKSSKKINLSELSEKIQDDIIQISQRKDNINFSTSILVSLNNRLKESEKKLILLSQTLLHNIIEDIQKNIDILFDINYEISVIDMILSFVSFIKKYNMVSFCRPHIINNSNEFAVEGLKTVWTNESKFQISNQTNLKLSKEKKILIIQKKANSFDQLNTLYSIGYLTILSQIGCFVPATSYKTDIYHTLLSKIHLTESIQNNLSHFQMELYHFKNVLDNVLHKNAKSLLLFDELIKGTQYEEEVCLSLALINQLSNISGKTFMLISDVFQINVIRKLQASNTNEKIQKDFQEDDKEQLLMKSVQIQKASSPNDINKILQSLNFSDKFENLFDRLSLQNKRSKFFK